MVTVMFVHGLESGPRGRKARHLEDAGFRVVSVKMPCGFRDQLRDYGLWAGLTFSLLVLTALVMWKGWLGLAAWLVLLLLLHQQVRARWMRRVLRRSVAAQRRLLESESVDGVLGSSFGGAVVIELLRLGLWKGPTVLLCPAHHLVASRARTVVPRLPLDASSVLVVHGKQDETVPFSDSVELVRDTRAVLIAVEDDHRLSKHATAEGLRTWVQLVC